MMITSVLLARAILLVDIRVSVYLPDVIAAIRERYGFVRVPTTTEEILSPDGTLTFHHGQLIHPSGTKVLVSTLKIHREAIVVDVESASTNEADLFITELIAWWNNHFGAELQWEIHQFQPRLYVSHLEVAMDVSLDGALAQFATTTSILNAAIARYAEWERSPPPEEGFVASSIALAIDPQRTTLPCDFRIERRLNARYESNRYFSQAPLKTDDHRNALCALEAALKQG